MPVIDGRLTCCSCGADLGDAEDPYRDPNCDCSDREADEADPLEERRCDYPAYHASGKCGCGEPSDDADEDEDCGMSSAQEQRAERRQMGITD